MGAEALVTHKVNQAAAHVTDPANWGVRMEPHAPATRGLPGHAEVQAPKADLSHDPHAHTLNVTATHVPDNAPNAAGPHGTAQPGTRATSTGATPATQPANAIVPTRSALGFSRQPPEPRAGGALRVPSPPAHAPRTAPGPNPTPDSIHAGGTRTPQERVANPDPAITHMLKNTPHESPALAQARLKAQARTEATAPKQGGGTAAIPDRRSLAAQREVRRHLTDPSHPAYADVQDMIAGQTAWTPAQTARAASTLSADPRASVLAMAGKRTGPEQSQPATAGRMWLQRENLENVAQDQDQLRHQLTSGPTARAGLRFVGSVEGAQGRFLEYVNGAASAGSSGAVVAEAGRRAEGSYPGFIKDVDTAVKTFSAILPAQPAGTLKLRSSPPEQVLSQSQHQLGKLYAQIKTNELIELLPPSGAARGSAAMRIATELVQTRTLSISFLTDLLGSAADGSELNPKSRRPPPSSSRRPVSARGWGRVPTGTT